MWKANTCTRVLLIKAARRQQAPLAVNQLKLKETLQSGACNKCMKVMLINYSNQELLSTSLSDSTTV